MFRSIPALTYLSILSLAFFVVDAQNCYVPSGQLPLDAQAPCSSSSNGAACCPLNWQCLSNGLCYNPSAKLYQRAGCTDKNWQSDACLQYCTTDNGSAGGNQAVNNCGNGKYCCNANNQIGDCCKKSGTKFFDLPEGKVIATITSVPPTTVASSASASISKAGSSTSNLSSNPPRTSSNPPSTSSNPSSTATPSPSSADAQTTSHPSPTQERTSSTIPSVGQSISSGSAGIVTVSFTTTVITEVAVGPTTPAESAASGTSQPDSSSRTGVIVGCAVGIPLVIALMGLLAFILWRRRRRGRDNLTAAPEKAPGGSSPGTAQFPPTGFYGGEPPFDGIAEIDGQLKLRPVSEIDGSPVAPPDGGFFKPNSAAELPGTAAAPRHSAANPWSTARPGYSPGMAPPGELTNAAGGSSPAMTDATGGLTPRTSMFPDTPEDFRRGVAVTPAGRYIPYRPPGTPGAPAKLSTS